jgi:hypothetical protein
MKVLDKWFLIGQLFLWLSVALITRFAWISAYPPSWFWIGCYAILGFVISSFLLPVLASIHPRPVLQQCIYSLIIAVVAGLLWRVLFNVLEYHLLESANNQFKFWGYLHNGKSAVTQMLLWVCGYWGIYYYQNYRRQQLRAEVSELEKKAAQLALLQYQINPHFLFNVLGSLDTLLLKKDSEKARKMLARLTQYLRTSLENEPSVAVSLTEEVQRIKACLDIEAIRFGERLQIQWSLPTQMPRVELPTGILLPIIENAIKHGDLNTVKGGEVSIGISTTQNNCLVIVRNEYTVSNKKAGFGIGLKNTRQRLKDFYHGLASLSIDKEHNHYCVTLAVPNE